MYLSFKKGLSTLESTYGSLERIKIITLAPEKVTDPEVIGQLNESYHTILPRIPKDVPKGAGILGIHAEGPFINPQKKGAHPENCIQTIDKVGF